MTELGQYHSQENSYLSATSANTLIKDLSSQKSLAPFQMTSMLFISGTEVPQETPIVLKITAISNQSLVLVLHKVFMRKY